MSEMSKFEPLFMGHAAYQMFVKKRPIALSHSVNARCNLHCAFCNQWQNPAEDMPFEDVCRIIDMAYGFGIRIYNAWSAEPLLREDLPEIMTHAHSLGMKTMLITNGKLLKKRLPDLCNVDYISVSVDGPTTSETIRGIGYDTLISDIRSVCQSGALKNPLLMNCVVSSLNVNEIEELVFLADELGARVSFEPVHALSGVDPSIFDSLILSKYDRRSVFSKLLNMKKQGYPIIHSKAFLKRVRDNNSSIRCRVNRSILGIDHLGNVYNCRVHDKPVGNVLKDSLDAVWKSSAAERNKICRMCLGCFFFGYLENNLILNYNIESLFNFEWF